MIPSRRSFLTFFFIAWRVVAVTSRVAMREFPPHMRRCGHGVAPAARRYPAIHAKTRQRPKSAMARSVGEYSRGARGVPVWRGSAQGGDDDDARENQQRADRAI